MKTKRVFSILMIFLISIGFLINLTACDEAKLSMPKETEVQESNEPSGTSEASESNSPEKEDKEEEAETEPEETKEGLAEKAARRQAEKQQRRHKEALEERTKEREIEQKRQKEMAEARKSLGKLYPKNTLTWNGITLYYQPLSERPELAFDSEMSDEEKSEMYEDPNRSGIWEIGTEFDAKDNKLTFFKGHNSYDAFEPFQYMKIGDLIYVTGKDGETYEYIVVDLAEIDLHNIAGRYYFQNGYVRDTIYSTKMLYDGYPEESIVISFCRDFDVMNNFYIIPTSDYERIEKEREAEGK